jgi:hypothetical protein
VSAWGWIGAAVWLVLGLQALWFATTGRKGVFGLPRDYREGWRVRVFGLAILLLGAVNWIGAYLTSRGVHVRFPQLEGITATFIAVLIILAILGRPDRGPVPSQHGGGGIK